MEYFNHIIEFILLPYLSTIDLISLSKVSCSFREIRKLVIKKLSFVIHRNLSHVEYEMYARKKYIYCDTSLYSYLKENDFSQIVNEDPIDGDQKDIFIMIFDFQKLCFDYTSFEENRQIVYDFEKIHKNVKMIRYMSIDKKCKTMPIVSSEDESLEDVIYILHTLIEFYIQGFDIKAKKAKKIIRFYINLLCKIKANNSSLRTAQIYIYDYLDQTDMQIAMNKTNTNSNNILYGHITDHCVLNMLHQILFIYKFQAKIIESQYDFWSRTRYLNNQDILRCYNFIFNDNYIRNEEIFVLYEDFLKFYVERTVLHVKNFKSIDLDKTKLQDLRIYVEYYENCFEKINKINFADLFMYMRS